jgi:hypothetical protein
MARSEAVADDFIIPPGARSEREEKPVRSETFGRVKEAGAAALGFVGEKSRAAFDSLSESAQKGVEKIYDGVVANPVDRFKIMGHEKLFKMQEWLAGDPQRKVQAAEANMHNTQTFIDAHAADYAKLEDIMGPLGVKQEIKDKMAHEAADAQSRLNEQGIIRGGAAEKVRDLERKRGRFENSRDTIATVASMRIEKYLAPIEATISDTETKIAAEDAIIEDYKKWMQAFEGRISEEQKLSDGAKYETVKDTIEERAKAMGQQLREAGKMIASSEKNRKRYVGKLVGLKDKAKPWQEKKEFFESKKKQTVKMAENTATPREKNPEAHVDQKEDTKNTEHFIARHYPDVPWEKRRSFMERYETNAAGWGDGPYESNGVIGAPPENLPVKESESEKKISSLNYVDKWNLIFGSEGYMDAREFEHYVGRAKKSNTQHHEMPIGDMETLFMHFVQDSYYKSDRRNRGPYDPTQWPRIERNVHELRKIIEKDQ